MLLSISVILLTISLYFLIGFFMQERQDNQLQQELQELMQKREDESEEDASGDSLIEIDAGILALHEENPDCIGWLTIDGTRIDYPVMYRPGDKNYYLHRDFNGEYSANGCLFLAEECVPGNSDNLIIYGHHMNSGKMFADLEKYKDEGFYEEHPTILFRTIWGNEQYQIFAAFTTPVYTGNDFVLSKREQWRIIKNLLLPLRKNHFIRQEQQQNTEIRYLHCLPVSIPRKMGVWYWLQRKITENYHRSGDDDHAGA